MRAIRARVPMPNWSKPRTRDRSALERSPRQAAFENQRRWLSLDLIDGAVDEQHPLWRYLMRCG